MSLPAANPNTASPTSGPRQHSEEGFVFLLVMFMLAVLIISMAVALPKIATSIQRDKEIETYHRGMQYRRAVQLYYKKFQAYPPNVDALVKTNEIRFLRKKYIDPMTGKPDWKPIMFGQNKTPMAMGFFGQPLGGMGGTGGPSGPNGITGTSFGSSSIGANPGIGGSSIGGSTIGNSTIGPGSTSMFGNNNTGTLTTGSTTGATDANGNPVDPNAGTPGTGPTMGGIGIIGFSPASPKQSLFVYKKKNHYNDWEFLYSPLSDQQIMGSGNTGTTPVSPTGVGAPGTTSPIGPTSPTSPTSPINPTSPPTPSQPQQ